MRRRRLLVAAGGLAGLGLVGWNIRGSTMQEIRFDLGKNIVETARQSGVPRYSVDNVNGSIFYSVNSIPAGIPARYTRPGYEIVWEPLFAFSMVTDRKIDTGESVHNADLLQVNSISSHAKAQAFVEATIAQFQKGKWQRYFHESSPRVTGRSSYLNEEDTIDAFSIDPGYRIPAEEWVAVAEASPNWHWIGDGVLAELSIRFYLDSETGSPLYTMKLAFDIEAIKNHYLQENEARELKEGDAKGWNSTARAAEGKKRTIERNKRLEKRAIERGDFVVPR